MKNLSIFFLSLVFLFKTTALEAYSSDPKNFVTELVNDAIEKLSSTNLILSVLRNFKILGIFSRLAKRDNKNRYLKYIPYTWSLIKLRTKNGKVFDELRLILNNSKFI